MSDVGGRLKNASGAMRDKADEATEAARSGVFKAVDQADDTFDKLRTTAADALEAGMDAAENMRDAAYDATVSVSEAVKASIERQPFTAVSVAAAAGFVFGMLFFRRR